ncbi:carbohydrate ABC transporter permease [Parasphaerochaeta coccoides]|uniref:Carbohydrate ABC transporter membrane protein 2, CUT1 family n=1 Tax=Parasphaerochaeta coccoides (strain ATCC BAA-1237 / DSM 17374 / SPN1) TaxID=760011 RepID=F4GHK0_PARC1|nr:carbohydrate ABC transporter permease [Parasphaerochaeta coccoides]AEC02589.1 carbohydrate ABC transporter membrane protein 2, CUT1 family [Parasphaerochaeta coccoides DSM 17374]
MIERKKLSTRYIFYVILLLITVVTLLPFAWMFSASLKPEMEVFSIPIKWIPDNPLWKNYSLIWRKIPLGLFTFNSAKLTVLITIIQLLTSSFAAYGFSKCRFKARDILFVCYIITIAIPWQVYMLPQYIIMQKFRLIDTHVALILMQSFTAFGVFLLKQFYQSIPDELMEAARIDGLSEYGIYARIVLPLSKPAMATLTIFSFVTVWNDFMGPMIYLNSTSLKTIQLGIRMFISLYSAEYNLIMAASLVALIPVFIMYVGFQKFFVQGVATSGLKV